DCIPRCQTRAHSFPTENGSAVFSQSDRHKIRCFVRTWSARFDRPRVAAQNKNRAELRSICKTVDIAGIRPAHRAASSTSDLDNQTVSALRPLRNIAQESERARSAADISKSPQESAEHAEKSSST